MPLLLDVDTCLQRSLKDQDSNASDDSLYALVRLQQIMEDAYMMFSNINWKTDNSFEEPATQYKLKQLRQRLEIWTQFSKGAIDSRKLGYLLVLKYDEARKN